MSNCYCFSMEVLLKETAHCHKSHALGPLMMNRTKVVSKLKVPSFELF